VNSRTDNNFSLTITLYILLATAATYLMDISTYFNSSTLSGFRKALVIAYGISIVTLVFCYILKQLHEEYEVKLPDVKFPIFTHVIHYFDKILLIDLFLTNCLLFVLVFSIILPNTIVIAPIIIILNFIPNLFYLQCIVMVVSVQLLNALVLWFIGIIKRIYRIIIKNIKHKG
jgi:hypothetical protein